MNDVYALMFDVGTSSLKSVLYNRTGEEITQIIRRYDYSMPRPGWVEMDPVDWENALWESLEEIGGRYNLNSLQGISFTGQMHTIVVLDGDGAAISPSIMWLDRRASQETRELQSQLKVPPYMLNSTYSLPKLLWMKKHTPEIVSKARKILWPKDYLRYLLTGIIATDPTEGIGAALTDWETGDFLPERLTVAGWDPSVLPDVLPSDALAGKILEQISRKYGINADVKIFTGYGDIVALLGGAPYVPGRLVYSLGSSSMFFARLYKESHPEMYGGLYSLKLAGFQLYGGVSSTTGASLVWAHENIWMEGDLPSMVDDVLDHTEAGCGGLVYLPYLTGERSPHWSDSIRGGFYGLGLEHDRRHMVRAVMEGVAYSIRHAIDIYRERGIEIHEIALSAGGAKTKGWSQIIADICQLPVEVYTGQETVTNVLMAMVKSNLEDESFENLLMKTFAEPSVTLPDPGKAELFSNIYERYRAFARFASEQD